MAENTTQITNISRRGFFKAAAGVGAGLALGFTLPESSKLDAQFGRLPEVHPEAYVKIGADDTVSFICPKAEMGQGPLTSLAQLLADELDCDWSKIKSEIAPVNPQLYGAVQSVVGSFSIRTYWDPMRRTGATARAMLLEAAAQKWGVDKKQLRTENGFVINTANNARLNYGAIAEAAAKLPVPMNVALKDPKDYRFIGKPVKRVDSKIKAMGQANFGMDTRLPGMLYAVLERPPVFGGKAMSFDASKAKAVPGVKDVIQTPSGIAVLAENTWAAMQGRKALAVQWDDNGSGNVDSAGITKMFIEKTQQPGVNARKEGQGAAALGQVAKKVEAVYEAPFLSHAPMEPMNCTAVIRDGKCEVWAPTQAQTFSRDSAERGSGVPKEKITINSTFMGGGFGRRGATEYVQEVTEIAKAVQGTPVKLVWSREDDMQHDLYRPASYVKFDGGLDANGNPLVMTAKVACPPFGRVENGMASTAVEGIHDMHYAIPNVQVDYHMANTHVPVTYWRSVGYSQNVFFMESYIDEMAHAAGKDPLEFRRGLLKGNARMLGVLNLAAEKAGWGKPLPKGHARGISVVNNIGSFTAQVAEVSIEKGKLKVHRVVIASDCGHNVNPAISRQQAESGMVYGLSAALKGAITIEKGRVQQANFHNYDVSRIDEMPVIETYLVPSTEAPGGMGEASTPGIAPAIGNAIFAATGKRLRRLPMRNADLA
ncbi:MAG: xanthine dehydrogenase family protein molybdopterin-binding subunit [Bryobacteraceae bacterium]